MNEADILKDNLERKRVYFASEGSSTLLVSRSTLKKLQAMTEIYDLKDEDEAIQFLLQFYRQGCTNHTSSTQVDQNK